MFPPVVTGTLITTIGLTLIPVAFQNMGGGNSNAKNFGDSKNLIVSFITIAIIIALEIWAKGFLKSISVLVGLILGTIIASFMGLVSLKPVIQASWFHLPQFFYFGVPKFEWSSSLTMIIIALVSMVESTGVFFATGDLLHKNISEDDLKRGYRLKASLKSWEVYSILSRTLLFHKMLAYYNYLELKPNVLFIGQQVY